MDNQPFEPKSVNIQALFTDTDARYQIPSYQRPYRWTDEEVNQLWEDLIESWEQDENVNYFLGSIITVNNRDIGYVDVVDGQQRLTTLTILFCVIRDLYPKLNLENKSVTNIKTVENSVIAYDDDSQRLRIFYPDSTVETDFFQSIVSKGSTSKLKHPQRKDLQKDTPKHKYINTAVNLREKLKELGKEKGKVESFVNYLFKRVQVIKINCADISFAIKLFQIINTRGLDLTPSDLIKSFLLAEIDKKEKSPDTQKKKKEQLVSDWRRLEDMSADCGTDIDNMLNIYLYYAIANNPKKTLFEELQKHIREEISAGKNPTEILGDIKKLMENYQKEIYNKDDKVVFSFWYLPWQTYWKSILLAALHVNHPDYEKLAKMLRRFYYLYWVGGKTLTRIKQTSFNLIGMVKEGKPLETIAKILQDKIDDDGIVADFVDNLKSNSIANERWCKPVLILLEYEEKDENKFIKLSRTIHLEHILPEKHKQSGWEHIADDVYAKFLNSGGNLTLLSGHKNINASNKPFKKKIRAYNGTGFDGDNKGVTAFAITQKIVAEYDHQDKQWDKDAMQKRKKWFLEEIAELLDITEAMKKAIESENSESN